MKKNVERIWEDVVNKKAVAISPSGCSVNGEAALGFSPYSDWKVCYLDKIKAYYLSNGVVEEEFD